MIVQRFKKFIQPKDLAKPCRLVVDGEELCKLLDDFRELYIITRGWKGTHLRINDQSSDFNGFSTALVVCKCANDRLNSPIAEDFCQSKDAAGWGCKRLYHIGSGLPRHAHQIGPLYHYWFQFGTFNKDRTKWHIDRNKLFNVIMHDAASALVNICPFFNGKKVKQNIHALPKVIELGGDSPWVLHYKKQYDHRTIQKQPIGIIPKHLAENRHPSEGLSTDDDEEKTEQKNRNIPETSFQDIGGIDEIIGMVREVIELPLKHPALIKHLGIAPHKGILLYGPPGCGKTLIAKAIANEIKAHFISIQGPELFTKWFGESEENLREIFQEARKFAPSIIFFDEIDAIAQKRSGDESVRHESIFLNQLLTLMDGMETYTNVCVIASTNRPELLDDAIMRPGRFDYTLEVKHPTPTGCKKIFHIHTSNMPLSPSVDINALSSRMVGFTGAEIAFVAREGAYNCLRRCINISSLIKQREADINLKRLKIISEDFEKALNTVMVRHKENIKS